MSQKGLKVLRSSVNQTNKGEFKMKLNVKAFADGLIGGAIFAWLYNLISPRLVTQEA